jgi:hypothetical protein
MDPETKVTLEDGSEISLAELIQSHKDLKDAIEINDTLQKDLQEVGVLFQAEAPPGRKEEAVRNVLQNLGYEDEQIEQYVQATRRTTEPAASAAEDEDEDEVEEIELPDFPEDDEDETSGGETEDPMSNSAEEIKAQLEAHRAELHKMRVRELRQSLDGQLDRVLKTNPEFQKLLEASRTLRGEEGARQAEQALRAQLEQKALDRMQTRRAAAGTFEDAWMAEEVEKAVEPVVGTFRSVIGDLDRLGRTSETADGLDAQEILRTKPVPAPEWKPGMDFSSLENQVKEFAADSIQRGLVESPSQSVV